MKLNIEKFAKIEDADIIVDGITVIAGENNTGKSTVGKILFSLFNALSEIEERILEERLKEIDDTSQIIMQNHMSGIEAPRVTVARNIRMIAKRIKENIRRIIEDSESTYSKHPGDIVEEETGSMDRSIFQLSEDGWHDMIEELSSNIIEILQLPEERLAFEAISSYFNGVFHAQINSLLSGMEDKASLILEIKGRKNRLGFAKNRCIEYTSEIGIMHKAVYIDNPFIIDELSQYNTLNPMNELLKTLLANDTRESSLDGIVEAVRAKEKLNDVYHALQNVVGGEITQKPNDEFYLDREGYKEPVSFYNLSTGMKSFVILKMLLEKGALKEKDVLILDEPEIHLHPQWQIAYAELIVLLQKHFDLSVVVTTHSPYFVDAINLYSCKYGSDDTVNYYLSTMKDDKVKMDLVTGNIDLIYKKMASPIQMLDTLRYELNNQ